MVESIVIDFDGTILPHEFPRFPAPYPETKMALTKLKEAGYEILIHTVRTASFWKFIGGDEIPRLEDQVQLIKEYLKIYKIPFDHIWLADKPLASFYIDDRAIRIEDGNWKSVLKKIGV